MQWTLKGRCHQSMYPQSTACYVASGFTSHLISVQVSLTDLFMYVPLHLTIGVTIASSLI